MVAGATSDADGLTVSRASLTAVAACKVVRAAVAQAEATALAVTVAVVDESGVLKALERMDGAPLVSVRTAQDKAFAAAAIGIAPDDFYEAIKADGAAVAAFANRPGLALIAGGLPLRDKGGAVAGAVGVAGAMSAADDRRVAQAAACAASLAPAR